MARRSPIRQASARPARNRGSIAAAIDGDPQTGWTSTAARDKPHSAVFTLGAPLDDADDLVVQLLFERYHAAGLGRFRISVTTDPRPIVARDVPAEIEDLLLIPEKDADARADARLRRALSRRSRPSWPRSARPSTSFASRCLPHPRRSYSRSARPRTRGRPSSTTAASIFSRPTGSSPPCSRSCPRCPGMSRPIGWPWRAGWSRRRTPFGPGDHEPAVGRVLRPRARADRRGFRLPGRAAHPSRAARLAGARAASARAGR